MHNFVSKTYAQKRRTDVREEGVEIHLLIISLIIMWYLVPFTLSFLKNMPFSASGYVQNPTQSRAFLNLVLQSFNKDGSQVGTGNDTFLISLPNLVTGSLSLTDRYYRYNSNSVQLSLTFWNTLIAGDYLLMRFWTDAYSSPSGKFSCPLITCAVSQPIRQQRLGRRGHPQPKPTQHQLH